MKKPSWKMHFGIKLAAAALTVATVNGATSARADDPYYWTSQPRSELRSTLLQVLQNLRLRNQADIVPDAESLAQAAKLVRTYRGYRSNNASMAIKDAPFLSLVVLQKGSEIFPQMYESQKSAALESAIRDLPLETIFDGIIGGYVAHTLPPALMKQLSVLGPCMAKKVLAGKSESCPLDPSNNHGNVSAVKLGWFKASCPLFLAPKPCSYRQAVYDYIKPDLIKAKEKREPALIDQVTAEFNRRYPEEFRKGFLAEMATRYKSFPQLVTRKFQAGTQVDDLWGPKAPLLEVDDEGKQNHMKMDDFADGLAADILTARMLARSEVPAQRGMVGALFYASANRLLTLTGEREARWGGDAFVVTDRFDPAFPKRAPVFAANPFGGWALGATGFSNWGWGDYDPTTAEHPSPYQLFPTEFDLVSRGAPKPVSANTAQAQTQNLNTLAKLLSGITEFITATRPDGPFAQHFGNADQIGEILNPDSPILFPRDGRMLAIGAMAGVLKNMIAANHGHLEIKGSDATGLPLAFHDPVNLAGRSTNPVPVASISRILVAAAELRKAINGDPDVPEALLALAPQLDMALQLGAMVLGAQGQEADGGFRAQLGVAQTTGRDLETQIHSIRALSRAYTETEVLMHLFRIKQAWIYLNGLWGTGLVPRLVEGQGGQGVPASLLWNLVNLWEETNRAIRPKLTRENAPEIDWDTWQARFEQLRARLKAQLRADSGPAPIGEVVN